MVQTEGSKNIKMHENGTNGGIKNIKRAEKGLNQAVKKFI